jgi:hypothetical protein
VGARQSGRSYEREQTLDRIILTDRQMSDTTSAWSRVKREVFCASESLRDADASEVSVEGGVNLSLRRKARLTLTGHVLHKHGGAWAPGQQWI